MFAVTGRIRLGVATGVAAMLLGTIGAPPALAAPDDELVWEEGTVNSIADGDTLVATLDAGSGARGSQRIRTIGVQAPEVAHNGTLAECGSAEATQRLNAQLPIGSRVQTRSVDVNSYDDYAGGRIVRSLYAQDQELNWYDTSRQTVSDGWMMWFPLAADSTKKAEWAHNLEYRVLADDAAAERRGLWSANLCGTSPYPNADLRVWAKYWGTEEVYVENRSGFDVDLSGWTVRDSGINGYRTLPAGTVVPAGQVRMVYSGDMNLNNLPPDNPAFEGDAVYLMDNAGPFKTGNLRAWFPYPCNPDECGDVLQGKVAMQLVQIADPPYTKPSAPGSVRAEATTNGTGQATVNWAEPVNLGGPAVTYTVTATPTDGGAPVGPVPVAAGQLSQVLSGLTLGRGYTFTVTASNSAGSTPSAATPAVAPSGLPGPPSAPTLDPRGTTGNVSAIASWQAPTGVAGEPAVQYAVTATPDPATDPGLGAVPATCTTASGQTSCELPGLIEGVTYSVAVTATLGSQVLVSGATPYVAAVPPTGTGGIAAPASVTALAGDKRAVVSWSASAPSTNGPVAAYEARVRRVSDGVEATCTTTGATSCVVPGLSNGTQYVAEVRANDGTANSAWSTPSASFEPYSPVTATSAGPTSAPPAADIWVGGEIVKVTNTSGQPVRLGGYGLWDAYSANGGSTDSARYLFPPDQVLGAGASLLVHFGAAPNTKPAPPTGATWLWTGTSTFINTDDFVELANLNRAQIDCEKTGTGTCRGSRPTAVPSSPVGITAQSSASSVTVNWGAPISKGGLAISGYTATAFDAPIGGNPISGCSAGGGGRSCSFPGALGQPYFVEVVAHNAQGTSGPSWRVRAVPKTVPGAPGNVWASGTPGGLNVTWTPSVENGAPITRYTAAAYKSATGGSPVGTCSTSNGSMPGCTIFGLSGGTYYVEVAATNRAGAGAPNSPRVRATADAGTAVSTYSKRKVTVRWDAPTSGTGITGYAARIYTKKSGGKYLGGCSAGPDKTSCRTKKLKKRSKYYIALTVSTTAGAYTIQPRIVTGRPKKPGRPAVTSAVPADRRVVISWNPPSFTGYTYLKTYKARLYSKKKGGSSRATCYAKAGTTTCTTKKLKKRTYYAAVRVKNSKGWSKWSKRVKVRVR